MAQSSGSSAAASQGTASRQSSSEPRQSSSEEPQSNIVIGSRSSTCPRSELNLFRMRPTGFAVKKLSGEPSTLRSATSCSVVEARSAATKKIRQRTQPSTSTPAVIATNTVR